jgi:phosphatidylinositol kinase/protein kinase (PI-3  family)
VPLNEEHGIVEWVPHTRVLRDIILKYLKQKGIQYNVTSFVLSSNPQYTEIRPILDSQLTDPSPAELFTKELLPKSSYYLSALTCLDTHQSYGNGLSRSFRVQRPGLKVV